MGFSFLIGPLLGSVAGFTGGKIEEIIMRSLDVILAFPAVLLAIFVVSFLGPSMFDVMLAFAIVRIPQMARVARS